MVKTETGTQGLRKCTPEKKSIFKKSIEKSKSSGGELQFTPTMAGEALGEEAGETVLSITVPGFCRVQHKNKAVCNLGDIQQGVHVSYPKKPQQKLQNRTTGRQKWYNKKALWDLLFVVSI